MDRELPVGGHLAELRKRVLISLAFFVLAAGVSFNYSPLLLGFLKRPLSGIVDKLVFFSPQEAFSIYLNISFTFGLLLSLPVLLYEIWRFVEPATGDKLRKRAFIFVGGVFIAFVSGAAFAYFILVPPALKFLLGFAGTELQPVISAQKYISFVVWTALATGLVFEMPVLSYILTRLGMLNSSVLRRKYRYAVAGILITAAMLTTTSDIFNLLLFAVPMLVLYELSIWVSKFAAAGSPA